MNAESEERASHKKAGVSRQQAGMLALRGTFCRAEWCEHPARLCVDRLIESTYGERGEGLPQKGARGRRSALVREFVSGGTHLLGESMTRSTDPRSPLSLCSLRSFAVKTPLSDLDPHAVIYHERAQRSQRRMGDGEEKCVSARVR